MNANVAAARRRLLLAAGTLAALPGRSFFRRAPAAQCPNDSTISSDALPLTIDVHAHVFNGSDLQVKAFFERIIVKQDGELARGAAELGNILQDLGWEFAPSAADELKMLEALK